jgi:hypothetical protein
MTVIKEKGQPPREIRVCRAIRLLAGGTAADEVARVVRVLPRTLDTWQGNDDFQGLLRCMKENGRLRDAYDALHDLTDDAVDVLHRALEGSDDRIAVQAAKDVLDRVGLIRQKEGLQKEDNETVIQIEYKTPDGKPYSSTPWADRHPRTSGAVQGSGVWPEVREDGSRETADD